MSRDPHVTAAESENRPDARFCRTCGDPLVGGLVAPAEVTGGEQSKREETRSDPGLTSAHRQGGIPRWVWIAGSVILVAGMVGGAVLVQSDDRGGESAAAEKGAGSQVELQAPSGSACRPTMTVAPRTVGSRSKPVIGPSVSWAIAASVKSYDGAIVEIDGPPADETGTPIVIRETVAANQPVCIEIRAVGPGGSSPASEAVCKLVTESGRLISSDSISAPADLQDGDCVDLVQGERWSDSSPWFEVLPCELNRDGIVYARESGAVSTDRTRCPVEQNPLLPPFVTSFIGTSRSGARTLVCVAHGG